MVAQTATENKQRQIFLHHTKHLRRFGADTDLVRYALSSALDELAEAMHVDDDRSQDVLLARIEFVLESHDSALYSDVASDRTDLATAIDAALTTERNAFAALTNDLRLAQTVAASQHNAIASMTNDLRQTQDDLTDMRATHEAAMQPLAEWLLEMSPASYHDPATTIIQATLAELRRGFDAQQELATLRQQLAQLDADNAKLTQELRAVRSWVTAPSNGNGKSDPALAIAQELAAQSAPPSIVVLSPEANDYWIGLDAARWTWRQVPKSIRLELVRHVIAGTPNRSQSEFDAARPSWMATASSHAHTFGVLWSQLSDLTREIEVAA